MEELLDAKDVVRITKLSRAQAYRLMKEKLPHIKFGRAVRVRREALEKWMAEQTVQPRLT
jgi:excisionase family DNA binding protein